MALDWPTLDSSEVLDCGSGATLDDLLPSTLIMTVYPVAFTGVGSTTLASKENSGDFEKSWSIRDTGQVTSFGKMSGTNITARSEDSAGNRMTINNWWFYAATFDGSFVPRLYLADISGGGDVAETAYAIQTTGSGAQETEAAANFRMGNGQGLANSIRGRIADVAYLDTALSLNQIRQYRSRFMNQHGANMMGLWHLGFNGTGTQPDYSGNGNNGTVTGLSVADHAPLGSPFSVDLGWQGAFAPLDAMPLFQPLQGIHRQVTVRPY